MKILIILCCLITFSIYSQDTINNRVSSSWYARSMFISLLNSGQTGSGVDESLYSRNTNNIEIGRSFTSVDIGICYGKINLINYNSDYLQVLAYKENTNYLQSRLTLNVAQYGIFSNEISVGGGYIFHSRTPVMSEISTTIFAQVGRNYGIGVIYGAYNFTGNHDDLNKTFMGIYLRYGLLRDDKGSLVSKIKNTKPKHKNNNI